VTKYYFDLVNGAVHRDQIGAELTDDGAAKQEALMRALVETSHQIARYAGSEGIVVRNELGNEIFRTRIVRIEPSRLAVRFVPETD
jgi:Domain of unknown function (DUF6894)